MPQAKAFPAYVKLSSLQPLTFYLVLCIPQGLKTAWSSVILQSQTAYGYHDYPCNKVLFSPKLCEAAFHAQYKDHSEPQLLSFCEPKPELMLLLKDNDTMANYHNMMPFSTLLVYSILPSSSILCGHCLMKRCCFCDVYRIHTLAGSWSPQNLVQLATALLSHPESIVQHGWASWACLQTWCPAMPRTIPTGHQGHLVALLTLLLQLLLQLLAQG
jgi:hypothetical protein